MQMEQKKKVCLILQLGSGKYWVAETANPRQYESSCIEGHNNTAYVKKYGFEKIIEETIKPCRIVILSMMKKYGIENVRGTVYPKEELQPWIENEIKSALGVTSVSENTLNLSNLGANISNFIGAIPDNSEIPKSNDNLLASILNCEKKTLYILKLKHGRFYVGTTEKDLNIRIQEHIDGRGSWFTKAYPFKECIYSGPILTNFDEDNMTEALMFALGQKGVDLVRGGSYNRLAHSNAQREVLQRKFDHNRNACLNCGEKGHMVRECPYPDELLCNRCNARGHMEKDCKTVRYENGERVL